MPQVAVPFDPSPPEKFAWIVSKCCEHRPWFHDPLWLGPELARRELVIRRLLEASWYGKLWETRDLAGGATTGVILFDRLDFPIEAYGHFIFFDHELRNKRRLLLSVLDVMLNEVRTVRTEVPEYANRLARFARKVLGLRYDAEWLGLPPDEAKRVSRKRHATLYNGEWSDVLCLSVDREGFANFMRDGAAVETDVRTAQPQPTALR